MEYLKVYLLNVFASHLQKKELNTDLYSLDSTVVCWKFSNLKKVCFLNVFY